MSSWMVEHGAKQLTFLSRSGVNGSEAQLTIDDLRDRGIGIDVMNCDVTVKSDVVAAVRKASNKRPIKGVLHAAMVLEVRVSVAARYENE